MPKPRVPTKLKKLRGEKRPCRLNVNEPEPSPVPAVMKSPRYLSRLEKAHYEIYYDVLKDMRVLTEADLKVLEIFSKACAAEIYYAKVLEKEGHFTEERWMDSLGNERINKKPHPAIIRREKAMELIHHYSNLLGLNPAARTRLKAEKQPDKDEVEAFLSGKKQEKRR